MTEEQIKQCALLVSKALRTATIPLGESAATISAWEEILKQLLPQSIEVPEAEDVDR